MAQYSSTLQFAEKDGQTFTVGPVTASPVKTIWNNAVVLVSVSQVIPVTGGTVPVGVTVTIGSSTGKAPTAPSATVGFLIPPNTIQAIYLGANRDQLQFFNLDTVNSANVSIVGMAV